MDRIGHTESDSEPASNAVGVYKSAIAYALAGLDDERRKLDSAGLAELLAVLTEIEGDVSRLADRVAEDQVTNK